jgi:hypothetical protein
LKSTYFYEYFAYPVPLLTNNGSNLGLQLSVILGFSYIWLEGVCVHVHGEAAAAAAAGCGMRLEVGWLITAQNREAT